ncbi:hypothetical protein LTR97_012190 [Elasticomyces elasticus]|uniref:Uncharacterized protein n=1 Tax=Elasticomyces elasticus TaxID=574655 RepID=A0AAN7VZD0_9PEZI|nr:hypothetical protein LTR97_012190 [Elasticomyces elasticus]
MAAIFNVLNMPLLAQQISDAWLQQGLPQPLALGNPQERAALHAVRSNITHCFGLTPRVDRRTWIVLHFVDRLGTAGMNMAFDKPGLYRPLVQNLSVVYSLHLGEGSLAMGLTTNFNLHRPTVRSTVAQFPNLRRLQSEFDFSVDFINPSNDTEAQRFRQVLRRWLIDLRTMQATAGPGFQQTVVLTDSPGPRQDQLPVVDATGLIDDQIARRLLNNVGQIYRIS